MFDYKDDCILNEAATPEQVMDAIRKKYRVRITYSSPDAKSGEGKGERIIDTVAYGLSKANNEVIRAFQENGSSETDTVAWKMFKLENIESWEPIKNSRFKEPPGTAYYKKGRYNKAGDKEMNTVYCKATFGNGTSNIEKYNERRRKEREANDPLYGIKSAVRKSYQAPENVMKYVDNWQKPDNFNNVWDEYEKGNASSISDMSKTTDFGDNSVSTTVGPVSKGNTETQPQDNTALDYNGASNNGPVYKQANSFNYQDDAAEQEQQNTDMFDYQDDAEEEKEKI